jgi:hypothetical protein
MLLNCKAKLQAWSFGDVHFELVEVAYKNKNKYKTMPIIFSNNFVPIKKKILFMVLIYWDVVNN